MWLTGSVLGKWKIDLDEIRRCDFSFGLNPLVVTAYALPNLDQHDGSHSATSGQENAQKIDRKR
jgi:hypothetical protein